LPGGSIAPAEDISLFAIWLPRPFAFFAIGLD
jgi:hypothetical protein